MGVIKLRKKALRKKREKELAKMQQIFEQAMFATFAKGEPVETCSIVPGQKEFPKDLEVKWTNAPQSE